jgi:hypothetical protein
MAKLAFPNRQPTNTKMQEPTHILAGVIIQKCFDWKKFRKVGLVLTAVIAFLSHGLLDKLANVTYHPGHADFHSVVWVSYHLTVLVVTILFLYLWWRRYWVGILFAMLPDLDWVFIHGQELFHIRIPFYRQPHMHHLLHWIYAQVPALSFLDHLPNNRENPWAMIWEVLLVAGLIVIIRFSGGKKKSKAKAAKAD